MNPPSVTLYAVGAPALAGAWLHTAAEEDEHAFRAALSFFCSLQDCLDTFYR